MAVDTRNKRMSMISMARPFRPTMPAPSGAFDAAAERAQLAYRYSGLLAADDEGGGGGGGIGTFIPTFRPRRRP